ncbi:MAG: AMP-binding protein [Planctomycetes bacterium]|nr:AMP-binding protein [Planctomycetota bacterium]
MNSAATNVASHLSVLAAAEPERTAIVLAANPAVSLTFRQLHEQSDRLAQGLERIGIRRGVRTVLMVPPSLDFFTLTFALFKIGAVPVLIDPGMGIRNLGVCLAEAEPEGFIGIPKANLARKLLGWSRASIKVTVTTGRLWAQHRTADLLRENTGPYPIANSTAEEVAAILFTSGSTGIAKGVVYTHGIFANQVELLRRTYGITNGEIDLATFPLFALFGPALGMTAVVPDMDPTKPAKVDPRKILKAIEHFGVTNLFGSPALINAVGRFGQSNGSKLPTLKRVISAGAPVPAKVIERFTTMLGKGVEVHTPYGATEALPVASIGSDVLLRETRHATDRGCGVCVGFPVEPVQVRIIPITDEPIAEWSDEKCLKPGVIGEIAVSGPVVTQSYFRRPQANELAKIPDRTLGVNWHRMGDVGYLDVKGRLWFCGRKSQRVVTKGGTLFTIPCEAIFNTHPAVFRSALVPWRQTSGLSNISTDQRSVATKAVLCVELERSAPAHDWPKIHQELATLAQRFPHTRTITTFLKHQAFPVDIRHNAKIFREKLAIWASHQLGEPASENTEAVALPPTEGDGI